MSKSVQETGILESVTTSSRRGFLSQAGLATLGVLGASKLAAAVNGPLARSAERKLTKLTVGWHWDRSVPSCLQRPFLPLEQ
jgi:hypothetical protein